MKMRNKNVVYVDLFIRIEGVGCYDKLDSFKFVFVFLGIKYFVFIRNEEN